MIELLPFQTQASDTIVQRFRHYLENRPLRGTERKRRVVPFYQALEAITGAGKTAILADAVERMRPVLPVQPLVLWLSKGRVVVAQTYANIQHGGKYRHLIESYTVHLLSEFRPEYAADEARAHLFFATVGTFNQRDKEQGERLIFKSDIDTAELSTWEALKRRETARGVRRPLLVVYDEAQNLTDQQTALLLELEPDAFVVASATMRLPAALGRIVTELKEDGWTDETLVAAVAPADVAGSGLIKDELLMGGYESAMEPTIDEMLGGLAKAEAAAAAERLGFRPKCIYVCKTNIVEGNSLQRDNAARPFPQREAPPILIWRYLVEEKKVAPESIAVYCSLEFKSDYPPPASFRLFKGGDNDYDEFVAGGYRHVIFNLSLQEGWDDPACYFAYVDKSMGSNVQVEQLVGRVLRQPGATHYRDDGLNTAHFYVRVDSKSVFKDVVEKVRRRIDHEAPEIRVTAYDGRPGAEPVEYAPREALTVPKVYRDASATQAPIALLVDRLADYRGDTGANTKGEGARTLVQQRVGERDDAPLEWVPIEHNNPVSARWVFNRAVMQRFPSALEVVGSDDPKFDARIELGSRAHAALERLAADVVEAYLRHVRLRQRAHNPYTVGTLHAAPNAVTPYPNSLHGGYAGLNKLEAECAEALDRTSLAWCRNPPRSGYGIPLLSLGRTREFYPDFLVWRGDDVYTLDTTGEHLLHERTARKLLTITPGRQTTVRVHVRLLSRGAWNGDVQQVGDEGFTVWGLREDRELGFTHHEDMDAAVAACLQADSIE